MKAFCAACGKKVPKRRIKTDSGSYAGLFCSTPCHISYADQMLHMMRETELEVEDEIKKETSPLGSESWTTDALDALDHAAAAATTGTQSPEEIAAKFIGTFAGKFGVKYGMKFASRLYGGFADTAKAWAKKRAERKSEPESQAQPPPAAKTPPPDSKTATPPKHSANGQHKNGSTPKKDPSGWKHVPEPKDLDDLPLEEQREWLLRRFYLPPTTTREELNIKFKATARRHHPDRASGNAKIMALVNATRQRIIQIEDELAAAPKRKRKA